MNKPVVLIIFDGWGIRDETKDNAIANAKKPFFDHLWSTYPHAKLCASGACVGLPNGEMGNSEVGHLTIGAGKIIDTDYVRINKAIAAHELENNIAFQKACNQVKKYNTTLHLIGLVSPGGVHSHQEHLYALLSLAKEMEVQNVAIHVITDGRDTPPQSAAEYVGLLEEKIKEIGIGYIASVMGRYYAMDRDHNWDRTKKAEDTLFFDDGPTCNPESVSTLIKKFYAEGKEDEFLEPVSITKKTGEPIHIIGHDSVIFFNFRADRARQLSKIIADQIKGLDLCFVTFTEYDKALDHVAVAFPPITITTTLASEIAKAGLTQLHVAETEKYAHVTYFLNGGREEAYEKEQRILIESRKDVATHDQAPEMKAKEIAEAVVANIEKYDFIVLNFANADMVGHTGNYDAVLKAIETVDAALKVVVESTLEKNGIVFITADHGNAEVNKDPATGVKHTAHTTNPVPALLTCEGKSLHEGGLSDVAPTILALLDIHKPSEMTGNSLIAS